MQVTDLINGNAQPINDKKKQIFFYVLQHLKNACDSISKSIKNQKPES